MKASVYIFDGEAIAILLVSIIQGTATSSTANVSLNLHPLTNNNDVLKFL